LTRLFCRAFIRYIHGDKCEAPPDGLAEVVQELTIKGIECCDDAETSRYYQIAVALTLVPVCYGQGRIVGVQHGKEPSSNLIVLDERHLRRLAQDYVRYYHQDRTHDALNKDTPAQRPTLGRNAGERRQSMPRLCGLHHRYFWAKAA
jgi:hypothetical protein